jgi:hypothetical protein
MPKYDSHTVQTVESLAALDKEEYPMLGVFANYVYDIKLLLY